MLVIVLRVLRLCELDLPHELYSICAKLTVIANNRPALSQRLCNNQPIEWIFVIRW